MHLQSAGKLHRQRNDAWQPSYTVLYLSLMITPSLSTISSWFVGKTTKVYSPGRCFYSDVRCQNISAPLTFIFQVDLSVTSLWTLSFTNVNNTIYSSLIFITNWILCFLLDPTLPPKWNNIYFTIEHVFKYKKHTFEWINLIILNLYIYQQEPSCKKMAGVNSRQTKAHKCHTDDLFGIRVPSVIRFR